MVVGCFNNCNFFFFLIVGCSVFIYLSTQMLKAVSAPPREGSTIGDQCNEFLGAGADDTLV